MTPPAADAARLIGALLRTREPDATLCPSEVARQLAAGQSRAEEWRALMPVVHAAVDALAREGRVRLSWKGKPLAQRAGPYRIGWARR